MRTFPYPSSDGTRMYTATLADDGKLLCNCKGWTMKKLDQPRHCTHTKKVVLELGGTIEARGEFAYLVTRESLIADAAEAVERIDPDELEAYAAAKRYPRSTVIAAARAIDPATFGPGPDGTHVVTDDRGMGAEHLFVPVKGQTGCATCGYAKGHHPTAAQLVVDKPPAPMLASAMVAPVTGVAFDRQYGTGWAMEEKLDGHRCVAVVRGRTVRAFSRPRAGKTALARDLPAHIVTLLQDFPDGVYDGELVAPSGKSWDVVVVGAKLVFVIFDVIGEEWQGFAYHQRRHRLLQVLATMRPGQQAVSTVESLVPSWAGVQAIWQRGGEGVILKRLDSTYRPGARSPEWVKVKQVHAATLTIVGYQAGKSGPYSAVELRDDDGHTTTVKTLDNALLREFAANPSAYIGHRVVISYQEKTPGGSYRHGMWDHFAGLGE